jgi:Tol biopolymer transport system component
MLQCTQGRQLVYYNVQKGDNMLQFKQERKLVYYNVQGGDNEYVTMYKGRQYAYTWVTTGLESLCG